MSTLGRIRTALRSAARGVSGVLIGAFGGWVSEGDRIRNPASWGLGTWGRRTQAGENVGPERALSLSAYYAALRNISEDVGKLPLITYRRLEPRGKERAPSHAAYRLLKTRPNRDMSSMTMRETLTHWAIGWGRGCAEIVRDGRGRPTALWPIHPSRIYPKRIDGELMYPVSTDDLAGRHEPVVLRSEDVLHIHGLGGGYDGYSLVQLAAESIGLGLAAELSASSFFGNGQQLSGVLQHPGKLGDKAMANLRSSWMEMHSGARNAHKPAILEEGMTYNATSIPPKDAQLVESRTFSVIDIARWLRMPPHKLAELTRSTNNNIEHQGIEYVVDTLLSWIIRWEQELEAKIFLGDPEHFAGHILTMLLRGDSKARSEFYSKAIFSGWMSPDDVRELEDMNPIPGGAGSRYYMQSNMAPLDLLAEGAALAPARQSDALALLGAGRNGHS